MSRLRGRIEVVLASAQVAGWIDPDKPNPARWHDWLDHMLPTAEEDRLARPPRGDGLPRSAHLHRQARPDGRRLVTSARLHRSDLRANRRGLGRDMGRDRLSDRDVDHPERADENGQAPRRSALGRRCRDPARSGVGAHRPQRPRLSRSADARVVEHGDGDVDAQTRRGRFHRAWHEIGGEIVDG